jgi:hypothetical protein
MILVGQDPSIDQTREASSSIEPSDRAAPVTQGDKDLFARGSGGDLVTWCTEPLLESLAKIGLLLTRISSCAVRNSEVGRVHPLALGFRRCASKPACGGGS